MFHSETMARVVHADRVRDLDRIAHERRLLAPADATEVTRQVAADPRHASASANRPGCGDSAGVPA